MSKPCAAFSLVFVLSSLLAGCVGENEEVVFVEPSITAPEATIEGGVLGATVSGSYKLELVLGPRASGPSTVKIGAAAITDALNQQSVVPSISLISDTELPVTVQLDSKVTVGFLFDLEDQTIPQETANALCLPGGVRIAMTLQDSLQDGATTVASNVFKPTGCM